ncbi:uncharacterized protein STEHIDRAFT_158146 [Stereum hirsutum FP-91666 SS1]|uniref:uncharacterized protein n=1 Tax=Stereum hirsutum (strain FP-91666) TaxID=721885 RepID=UPI000444A06B|nr:uncharacterized protein STEHIDRAFT_158146 [Stereum hirsutum FP-91666 SS1]EIM85516.1 hypothetical protein STEHIDRAFT_158146 [Stereum hirsutum FP-91666 SS1]
MSIGTDAPIQPTLLPEPIFVTSLSASASRSPASLVLVVAFVDPTSCTTFASAPSTPAVLVRDDFYLTAPPSVVLASCFRPHSRARCGTSPPSGIILARLSGSPVDVCGVRWVDVRVRWLISTHTIGPTFIPPPIYLQSVSTSLFVTRTGTVPKPPTFTSNSIHPLLVDRG